MFDRADGLRWPSWRSLRLRQISDKRTFPSGQPMTLPGTCRISPSAAAAPMQRNAMQWSQLADNLFKSWSHRFRYHLFKFRSNYQRGYDFAAVLLLGQTGGGFQVTPGIAIFYAGWRQEVPALSAPLKVLCKHFLFEPVSYRKARGISLYQLLKDRERMHERYLSE